jgi:hypothetical protein
MAPPGRLAEVVSLLPGCVGAVDEATARMFDLFCWRVVELRDSRLIDHGNARISVGWHEDGIRFQPLSAKESIEAFESLCVRFRRLTLESEQATFSRVRNELGRLVKRGDHRCEPVQEWLAELKNGYKELQRRWALADLFARRESSRVPITPKPAFDLVFNGEMFHADPDKSVKELGNWRLMVAAELYQQIVLFSDLSWNLLRALERFLPMSIFFPAGFSPFLTVSTRTTDGED